MQRKTFYFGFITALIAFIAASGYGIVQLLQLFHVTSHTFDDILIYAFSLLISLPFLFSILAFHYTIPRAKRLWSHAVVLLSLIYAT
jgi:hypothetical protein